MSVNPYRATEVQQEPRRQLRGWMILLVALAVAGLAPFMIGFLRVKSSTQQLQQAQEAAVEAAKAQRAIERSGEWQIEAVEPTAQ